MVALIKGLLLIVLIMLVGPSKTRFFSCSTRESNPIHSVCKHGKISVMLTIATDAELLSALPGFESQWGHDFFRSVGRYRYLDAGF